MLLVELEKDKDSPVTPFATSVGVRTNLKIARTFTEVAPWGSALVPAVGRAFACVVMFKLASSTVATILPPP